MNKFIIFLLMLVLTISNASVSYAQENEQEKVTQKTPVPQQYTQSKITYQFSAKMRENGMKPPKPFLYQVFITIRQLHKQITNAKHVEILELLKVNVGMYNAKVKTNCGYACRC